MKGIQMFLATLKNITLFCIAVTSFIASGAEPSLRIDILAESSDVALKSIISDSDLKLEHPWWDKDPKKERRLWVTGPQVKDKTWQKASFTFSSDKDCRVKLSLNWGRAKDGNPEQFGAFRNIAIENTWLKNGDFSNGLEKWEDCTAEQLIHDDGKTIIIVSNAKPASQYIWARKNIPLKVSFEYRMAELSEMQKKKETSDIVYEKDGISLQINGVSGNWKKLSFQGKIILDNYDNIAAFALIGEKHKVIQPGSALRLSSYEIKDEKLKLVYEGNDWKFIETLSISGKRLSRQMDIVNTNDEWQKFYGFSYNFPLDRDGNYYFPATFFGDNTDSRFVSPWPEVPAPQVPLPRGNLNKIPEHSEITGYFRIWPVMIEKDKDTSLLFFGDYSRDIGNTKIKGYKKNVNLFMDFKSCGWAESGKPQHIDDATMDICKGTAEELLRKDVPAWFSERGIKAPADRPAHLYNALIYESGPGGGKHYSISDIGDFSDMRKFLLPRLNQLGFNTVWQMPVEYSIGGPYNPADYYQPNPYLGSYDKLRNLLSEAKKLNIDYWLDIVPHGGISDFNGIIRGTSPGACLMAESGNFIMIQPYDFLSPEWLNYMQKVGAFYTGDLGASGVRIDFAVGSYWENWRRKNFPASDIVPGIVDPWNSNAKILRRVNEKWYKDWLAKNGGEVPPLEYERASNTKREGGTKMVTAIRKGLHSVNKDKVALSEGGGPHLIKSSDIVHDRQFSQVFYRLRLFSPADFVQNFSLWLEEQQYADAPGAFWMRILACHDNAFPEEWCGASAYRAYAASAYFAKGAPLSAIYPNDIGHGFFLRNMNSLRLFSKVLREGNADYLYKNGAPEVFTVRRFLNEEEQIGLINFSNNEIISSCAWKHKTAYDIAGGIPVKLENGTAFIELPPLGFALLADKKREMEKTPVFPSTADGKSYSGVFSEFSLARLFGSNNTSDKINFSEDDNDINISTDAYKFTVNKKSGLPESFIASDTVALGPAKILTERPINGNMIVKVEKTADRITVRSTFGNDLILEMLCNSQNIKITFLSSGSFKKAALLWSAPDADSWQVNSWDGVLEDFYDKKTASARKGSELSYNDNHRLPANPSIYWNSMTRPLNSDKPIITFGRNGLSSLSIHIDDIWNKPPEQLLLINRFASSDSLALLMRLKADKDQISFTLGSKKAEASQSELKLKSTALGWEVDNGIFQVELLRQGGVMHSISKDGRRVLCNQDIISPVNSIDKFPMLLSFDFETFTQMWRDPSGNLHMRFRSQMGKQHGPHMVMLKSIRIDTEYVFNKSGAFRIFYRLNPVFDLKASRNPVLLWRSTAENSIFSEINGLKAGDKEGNFTIFDKSDLPAPFQWK